ncbi:hypothetical protein A2U01_0101993, partial [Trifolium medium]|nr:hypothetical protein [Trifolium medium]
FSFCYMRNAQLVLAQRAVQWYKGSLTFWRWHNARAGPVQRAVLPYFCDFSSGVGATRQ